MKNDAFRVQSHDNLQVTLEKAKRIGGFDHHFSVSLVDIDTTRQNICIYIFMKYRMQVLFMK